MHVGTETEQLKKRAPTLYAIIGLKLVKFVLFLTLAMTMYTLSDNDLPAELKTFLHHLRLNPERRFWVDLAHRLGELKEKSIVWASAATLFYSLFSLTEGIGLMFRVSWAGWLAIGESAFFIPIEVYELLHPPQDPTKSGHPITLFIILVLNVVIVWYLLENRRRLFRHHHHHDG
jgi:uncharacterized membrane protein (DUF2068 family)